jgi:hypothetical protein
MAAELRAKAAALSARPGPGPMARARFLLALVALVEAIARMILRWQEGQETPADQPRPARASTPFPADRAATWSRTGSRRTKATTHPDSASGAPAAHPNPARDESGPPIPLRARATNGTKGGVRGQRAPNQRRRTAPTASVFEKPEKGRAQTHALFVP